MFFIKFSKLQGIKQRSAIILFNRLFVITLSYEKLATQT